MDIDALLPLLLSGNSKNADMLKIFAAIRSGDKNKAIETLVPKGNEQLVNALKMANGANKKPPTAGLGAIEGFASNEILGMLIKFYS